MSFDVSLDAMLAGRELTILKRTVIALLTLAGAWIVTVALSSITPTQFSDLTRFMDMDRSGIHAYLERPPDRTTDSGDILVAYDATDHWIEERIIGQWHLFIGYKDGTHFKGAHARYSAPLFGPTTRTANLSVIDLPAGIELLPAAANSEEPQG